MVVEGLSVVDGHGDVHHTGEGSILCNEFSQDVHSGRPRQCPAGRLFDEPPGKPLVKSGVPIGIKSFRPHLQQRGQ